ncbi:N-acetylmuramoyl-L-alanine amidase family protein [Brevibacillus dissolubilis]|uniref:N-acetylmuramoyl-L-alanine amidase family protein n=1 Tax=Brevibacillus dissolubilis TaxID=1844116 RepID=UPI001116E3E5|nr:N-acetylmuramoyl-L-alanine amidase [Brevibacillus dissolubilis]
MAPLLIIDPGHGGIDPGGGSNERFVEKNMVLTISTYQYRRFQELGVSVQLTRNSDVTLESEERAAIIRESGATYCISNHINSGGGRGAEAIYSIYASAALPRELVEELASEGMPTRRVFTRTLPNNPRLDYYFIHRETGSVESVILEYGFADNAQDSEKIQNDWRDLAEAVVRGFCQFVGHPYRPPQTQGGGGSTSPGSGGGAPGSGDSGSDGSNPGTGSPGSGTGNPPSIPEWKQEAIDWLFEQGLLTNRDWYNRVDEPLPLWAEAIILRRLYEKLRS